MAARGVQVVVRDNHRGRLQIAATAVAQTAYKVIPHIRQIDA